MLASISRSAENMIIYYCYTVFSTFWNSFNFCWKLQILIVSYHNGGDFSGSLVCISTVQAGLQSQPLHFAKCVSYVQYNNLSAIRSSIWCNLYDFLRNSVERVEKCLHYISEGQRSPCTLILFLCSEKTCLSYFLASAKLITTSCCQVLQVCLVSA